MGRFKTKYMVCRFSNEGKEDNGTIKIQSKEVLKKKNSVIQDVLFIRRDIEDDVSNIIDADWLKRKSVLGVLCHCQIPVRLMNKSYKTVISPDLLPGSECQAMKKHVEKMSVAKMRMLCG